MNTKFITAEVTSYQREVENEFVMFVVGPKGGTQLVARMTKEQAAKLRDDIAAALVAT